MKNGKERKMETKIKELLKTVDHTLLKPTSTWEEIKVVCDEGMEYGVASVCIPPCYVRQAKEYVKNRIPICTVIGFPNGNVALETKLFETKQALQDGADEIDMVINIGLVKAGMFKMVQKEIEEIKKVCGNHILKVIIETCLLTEKEKIELCDTVTNAKADYIKTSTGFSTSGATKEDVALLRKYVGEEVKVKAAGGIQTLEDGYDFLTLGAERLGTSRIISLIFKENKKSENEY